MLIRGETQAIILLQVPPWVSPGHTGEHGTIEDVHTTRGAALLALEPPSKTAGVEDVVTR